ncbi:MAG TPA: molecular chaperone TorD family protein [Clostridia bacterium]|nr:molecular chaperone TorD family protein [Clostridia bacterium]
MPTPSNSAPTPTTPAAWNPQTQLPPRSVFGNYPGPGAEPESPTASAAPAPKPSFHADLLQSQIDLCVARAFIYRFLAKAYEDPAPETWRWLTDPATQSQWRAACLSAGLNTCTALQDALSPDGLDAFLSAYLVAFGHAARGQCPLNEIEYGELKADPLFQPHRLADLAAFYRAFGLEISPEAGERHDHLCLELEFMCVLAAKEAYALEHQLDADEAQVGRDAQRDFLREHLGRWSPAFARRLAATVAGSPLAALAEFTRAFIESECARAGVRCGGEDLLLRPVDQAAESLCASCALSELPPGAQPPEQPA